MSKWFFYRPQDLNAPELAQHQTPGWLKYMFVLVVLLAGLQLTRDLQLVNWSFLRAENGPLAGFLGQVLGQSTATKARLTTNVSDNFTRCQNKLGIDSGIGLAATDATYQTMREYYRTGVKYVVINVSDLSLVDAAIQLVQIATENHLKPVFILRDAPKDAAQIASFYEQIAKKLGDRLEFVASLAPQIESYGGNVEEAIFTANDAADALGSYKSIITATPVFTVNSDFTPSGLDEILPADESGVDLDFDRYDVFLMRVLNKDCNFGIRRSYYSEDDELKAKENGQDLSYCDIPETKEGIEKIFRGNYFFNTGDNDKDTSMSRWVTAAYDQVNAFMRTIIVDYAPADGTVLWNTGAIPGLDKNTDLTRKLVDRLADDFASFSSNPFIEAVIMDKAVTDKYEVDLDDFKRLSLTGTNCNYDLVSYEEQFEPRSIASPTSTVGQPGGKKAEAKIVCNDQRTCGANLYFTFQAGLPIAAAANNSPVGTNTHPYMSVAATLATQSALGQYNPLNQFAVKLQATGGGLQGDYTMPWLGSFITNAGQLAKINVGAPTNEWLIKQTISPGLYAQLHTLEAASESSRSQAWVTSTPAAGGGYIPVSDEEMIASGNVFTSKYYAELVDTFRDYDPRYQTFATKSTPAGKVYSDPQNMVYGSEIKLEETEAHSYKARDSDLLCYHAWLPDSENKVREYSPISCTSSGFCRNGGGSCTSAGLAPLADRICNEYDTNYDPPFITYRRYNEQNVRLGRCHVLDDDVIIANTDYVKGADHYEDSVVYIESELPKAPDLKVSGIYDAYALMYKQLQDGLKTRGLEIRFGQNYAWESDLITRAYSSTVNFTKDENKKYDYVIDAPRQNQMLEDFDPDYSIPGQYNTDYPFYPADGENFNLAHSYYPNLGSLDNLIRYYDIYLSETSLPTGQVVKVGASPDGITPTVLGAQAAAGTDVNSEYYFQSGLAEQFAGLLGCNEPAYLKLTADLGIDPKAGPPCIQIYDPRPVCGTPEALALDEAAAAAAADAADANTATTSSGYACPVQGGVCGKGPSVESHAGLSTAVDIFSPGGDQVVVAPYDGKVTAADSAVTNYCKNYPGASIGGSFTFEGNVNGQAVQLFFLHVGVDDPNALIGKTFKVGEQITRATKFSDGTVDPKPGGATCMGEREHVHIEVRKGSFDPTSFMAALGCNMTGAAGTGYPDYENYGSSCNPKQTLTLQTSSVLGAATSNANCKPALEPLAQILCDKGYPIDPSCQNQCPIEQTDELDAPIGKIPGFFCPLADPAARCFQGPYGGYTHCDASENDELPLDMYPAFKINKNDAGSYPEGVLRSSRDLRVISPEDGKIIESFEGQYGGVVSILGTKTGIRYDINHIEPHTLPSSGSEVTAGQQIGEVCTTCSYGYEDWHIHIAAYTDISRTTAINPYVLYGELLGCNATAPPAGAVYDTTKGTSNMCIFSGRQTINDNACSKSIAVSDNSIVRSKVLAASGQSSGTTPTTGTQSGGTTPTPATGTSGSDTFSEPLKQPAPLSETYQRNPWHNGIDYSVTSGTPVYAAMKGVVSQVIDDYTSSGCGSTNRLCGYGNYVEVRHDTTEGTFWTVYAHMSKGIAAHIGQAVDRNTLLGQSGSTGYITGPHLHFELRWQDCYDGFNAYAGTVSRELGSCSLDPRSFVGRTFQFGAGDNQSFADYCPTPGVDGTLDKNGKSGYGLEDVLKLCSPKMVDYVSLSVDDVYAAYATAGSTLKDDAATRARVSRILQVAQQQNLNAAYLFGYWFTEGGYLGDGIAGNMRDGRYPIAFEFGCAPQYIGERLGAFPGQPKVDKGFEKSLLCAAGATTQLKCSYAGIASDTTIAPNKGPGLGGFLECYGPISDGNLTFARKMVKIYDAFYPSNGNSPAKRISNGQCIMNI